ncbi:MAG TPA: hypothetical protein VGC39_02070 [Candidatus Methylacidiphilales bacterium]
MNRFISSVVGLLVLSGRLAFPDALPVPPPTAPFVATPRPGTHWEIRIEPKFDAPGGGATAAPAPPSGHATTAVVDCWLDDHAGRAAVAYGGGAQAEGYWIARRLYLKVNGGVYAAGVNDEDDLATSAMNLSKFAGTPWITLANYQGVELIDKIPCYKFHRAAVSDSASPLPEITAWIAVADKMPIQIRRGNTLGQYSAITEWKGAIDLPEDVRKKAEIVSREQQSSEMLNRSNAHP